MALFSDSKSPLLQEIKDYIQLELRILKLNILEKSAKILTFVIGIIVAVVLSLVAVAYFSVLIFNVLQKLLGSEIWSVFIMIILFLSMAFLTLIFSEKLFLNFFIKKIYSIIFQKEHEEQLKNEDKIDEQTNSKQD